MNRSRTACAPSPLPRIMLDLCPANFGELEFIVLCELAARPGQRLVHQHPSPPDETGHSIFPDSYFLRIMAGGVGKRAFGRLLASGLITQTATIGSRETGHQNEFGLSPVAVERFASRPCWIAADQDYRVLRRLPPRLAVVGGAGTNPSAGENYR